MKKPLLWLLIVLIIALFSLAGCEKYPDTEPPSGALPREVTTELDRLTGKREINHTLFISEDGRVDLIAGPDRKDRKGWILVYENGTEIQLNEDVTIGNITLKAGTKLMKVNKWWCEVFEVEVDLYRKD